jgi:hypothetical protein
MYIRPHRKTALADHIKAQGTKTEGATKKRKGQFLAAAGGYIYREIGR